MGQHTWMYTNYNAYKNREEILNWFENEELLVKEEIDIYDKAQSMLYDLLKSGYHDAFRTSKRSEDGSYLEDVVLTSKEECLKWLEDNKDTIYDLYMDVLLEFWDKYPNGCIDFG